MFDSDGRRLRRLVGEHQLGGPWVQALGFSPDGRRLLVSGLWGRNDRVGTGGRVSWIDLRSGRQVRFVPTLWPSGDTFPWSRFGDDGDVVAWSDDDPSEALVVDSATGHRTRLEPMRRQAGSLGYLPLPTGAVQRWDDGGLTLYNRRGREVQQIGAHTAPVRDVEVAANRRWAVSAGEDGAVRLWEVDARSGKWSSQGSLSGHTAPVTSAESTPDSTVLMTGSKDGTVISWDMLDQGGFGTSIRGLGDRWISNRPAVIEPGRLIVAPTRPAPASGPLFDTGGQVVAYFMHPRTGEVVDKVPVGHTLDGAAVGSSVSLSPDRGLVAVTSAFATAVLDADTRRRVSRIVLPAPQGSTDPELVSTSAWSPDGSRLYLGAEGTGRGDDGAIVVVDPVTGDVLDRAEMGFGPQAMELSPDSSELVAVQNAFADGEVEEPIAAVLDSATLNRKRTIPLGDVGMAFDVSYSPDGSQLAVVGDQGGLGVFDAATGEPVHPPARVHNDVAFQVEWLDGRTVASASNDGRVTLYDADRGVVRARPIPGAADGSAAYTFLLTASDEEIVAMTGAGPGRQYPLDPDVWLEYACTVAGRDLTRDEWSSYLPDRPYAPTCAD